MLVSVRKLELTFLGYRGGSFTAPSLCHDATGKIRVLFQWLREEQSSSYAEKGEVMDVILGTILAEIRRAHFILTHKAASGKMPMADLRLLRVETARDQLITAVLPLKAIAGATGFCDEYHLSRVFRKHYQVPSGYFRK